MTLISIYLILILYIYIYNQIRLTLSYLFRKAHLSSPKNALLSENSVMPTFPGISGCLCGTVLCEQHRNAGYIKNGYHCWYEPICYAIWQQWSLPLSCQWSTFKELERKEKNAGLFEAWKGAEAQVTERESGKKLRMPRELSPSLRDVRWSNKHTPANP